MDPVQFCRMKFAMKTVASEDAVTEWVCAPPSLHLAKRYRLPSSKCSCFWGDATPIVWVLPGAQLKL